jgi:hypothetical protein
LICVRDDGGFKTTSGDERAITISPPVPEEMIAHWPISQR